MTVPKYNDSIRSTAISNANKLASRSKKIKEFSTQIKNEYLTIDDNGKLSVAFAFTSDDEKNTQYMNTFLENIE